MSYFMSECYAVPGQPKAMIDEWPVVPGVRSWKMGSRFAVTLPQPLVFTLNPNYGSNLPPMFNGSVLLMQNELIDQFKAAGVTNLDCYGAIIQDPRSGAQYKTHQAVNIIGAVAALDAEKSKVAAGNTDKMISMDIDQAAIDPEKTRGALLFRLAECVSGIVVHSKVRDGIATGEFPGLQFVPPENWMG